MTRRRRVLVSTIAALAVVAVVVAALFGWHPAIAPITPPPRSAFSDAAVARGAQLAAVGNCIGCHTAAGGVPFGGGTPLTTPFGTIHGSNITPEPQTGIGSWPASAFVRAMRRGIARDGSHLYPAFPYDHFRHTGDADLQALYAFVMTRDPVAARVPANDLMFPLGFRPLIAGWNLLFLRGGPAQEPAPAVAAAADPSAAPAAPAASAASAAAAASAVPGSSTAAAASAAARGAHLLQSLGHCGACHTPRNALGAERSGEAFAGGFAEGWYAPPLNADNPSPQPWTAAAMSRYLRTGIAAGHAIAGGPMQRVTAQLAQADPADVDAIAAAVVAMMAAPGGDLHARRQARAAASAQRAGRPLAALAAAPPAADAQWALGASVYASACASCHDQGRAPGSAGALQMPLAVAVYDADPASLLRIVRDGIVPADGEGGNGGRWMPAFGSMLTDEQLTALAAFLRRSAADAPPWPDLPRAVAASARHGAGADQR